MVVKTRLPLLVALAIVSCSYPQAFAQPAAGENAASIEFFERKIRPLLSGHCYTCHSADTNSRGGLRVDDRNGLIYGGESGPAMVPGDPEGSLLLRAVSHTDENLKMPPDGRLSEEQIADLRMWIADGAAWPKVKLPEDVGRPNPEYDRLRREHWAWQPLRAVAVPAVSDAAWPLGNVDAFLLATLEAQQLRPVADADKLTWIRRTTYDLTGLPPTPAQIDAFLADASREAYDKVVDRLLASPSFGERWGRHWLDVARYAESTGSSRNLPYPHAWRYRDYVIAAFNHDKPYAEFIREQIAGDLLPAASDQQRDERRVATGFLALGVKDVNQRFKVRFVMDNIDEQIDAVSRSVLALTASCARCHDHKFDPIPTSDYYSLAGIFQSTDLCAGVRNKMGGGGLDYYDTQMLLRIGDPNRSAAANPETVKKVEELGNSIAAARAEFEALRGKPEGNEPGPDGRPKRAIARQKVNKLQIEMLALTDPAAGGAPVALGVRESKTIGDSEIRVRGEAEKLGPVVPRGVLGLVNYPGQPQINGRQSGRLELAQWLTDPANPLTPRVMVNRIWHHLFGQGLVKTVDNFGTTGDRPSHPELLDYLAARFVRDGWSIKRLIRTLVLSRAYRLGGETLEMNLAVDPANRWQWRHSPRRLDAEELRDAALAVAGALELAPPEASPAKNLKVVELRNNGPEARQIAAAAATSRYRSVYLPLLRGLTPRPLEVFDFAEQGMVTGSRDTTTVVTQALYLLNDAFIRRQSLALAGRLLARGDSDDVERLQQVYRLALGRPATSREVERALRYLSDYQASFQEESALAKSLANAEPPRLASIRPPGEATAVAGEESAPKPAKKKKAAQNPEDIDATDEPTGEDNIQPASAQTAAWASFCQALLGSGDFRYLK